jgi:hypothetical protein
VGHTSSDSFFVLFCYFNAYRYSNDIFVTSVHQIFFKFSLLCMMYDKRRAQRYYSFIFFFSIKAASICKKMMKCPCAF